MYALTQVEYASAGQLADRCRSPLPETQARALFSQLLDGLAYCHSKGVYHRDLRTELIFLSGRYRTPFLASSQQVVEHEGPDSCTPKVGSSKHLCLFSAFLKSCEAMIIQLRSVLSWVSTTQKENHIGPVITEGSCMLYSVFAPTLKIGGFGFSKSASMDSMAKTTVGSRGYMAPEILLATGAYDAAGIDVWACGVVLYQMLTGRMPFCHDANASGILDRAMMQRIVRGQCVPPS